MSSIHDSRLDLNLLLVFAAVYTERSATRAAAKLRMTQSGVSHALAKLRQLFGDDLLVRAGGTMVPTPRADQLYAAVRGVIETVESQVLPIAEFDPGKARREFITTMSDLSEVISLPPLMESLRHAAPGCTIRNVRAPGHELAQVLESGRAELAIGNVVSPASTLYQQAMYTHDFAVIAWSQHPRIRKQLSLERYLAEQHAVAAAESDEYLVGMGLAPRSLQRRVGVTVGGFMTIPWLIQHTELIATVPTQLAEMACKRFSLRAYPLPFTVTPYSIKTYWHPRSHSDSGHRWFREHVKTVMRPYPNWQA
jgi:DNA-binding transcriptional LysR family regulator